MDALKEWVPILAPIGMFVVGLTVAYVARQQWLIARQQAEVARNKLRLDLFDRRYRVFEAARTFLLAIASETPFDNSHVFAFDAGISDREFLFGSDVVDYLKEIKKRALDVRQQQRSFESSPNDEEHSKRVKTEHKEFSWLTEQPTAMTKVFTPYLGFSHIR